MKIVSKNLSFNDVCDFVHNTYPQVEYSRLDNGNAIFSTFKGMVILLSEVDGHRTKWGLYRKPSCKWYHKTMGAVAFNNEIIKGLPALVEAF